MRLKEKLLVKKRRVMERNIEVKEISMEEYKKRIESNIWIDKFEERKGKKGMFEFRRDF